VDAGKTHYLIAISGHADASDDVCKVLVQLIDRK